MVSLVECGRRKLLPPPAKSGLLLDAEGKISIFHLFGKGLRLYAVIPRD